MALVLPVDSIDEAYTFRTQISDIELLFEVNWNSRDESWYISISDIEATPIISGVKVVSGPDLLGNVRDRTGLPEGFLVALDTSQAQSRAGRNDLGDRVKLVFMFPEDLL